MSVMARHSCIDRDRTELAMSNSLLGDDGLREGHDSGRRPPEDHALDTVVVVEMCVQRRHRHIVVLMLHDCQASRSKSRNASDRFS